MTDLILTQEEADALLAIEKISLEASLINLPDLGGVIDIFLHTENEREEFLIFCNVTKMPNITRGLFS